DETIDAPHDLSDLCALRPAGAPARICRAQRSENDGEREAAGLDASVEAAGGREHPTLGFLATPLSWLREALDRKLCDPDFRAGVPLSTGRGQASMHGFSAKNRECLSAWPRGS